MNSLALYQNFTGNEYTSCVHCVNSHFLYSLQCCIFAVASFSIGACYELTLAHSARSQFFN